MLVGSKGETFLETIFCCCTLFGTVGMYVHVHMDLCMLLIFTINIIFFFILIDNLD